MTKPTPRAKRPQDLTPPQSPGAQEAPQETRTPRAAVGTADVVTPALFVELAVTPALQLLPGAMDTPQARAMLLAICLQESGLHTRRQRRGGPARSYAQFEQAGIAGVLRHPKSAAEASRICQLLDVDPSSSVVHQAIEWHDVLAVVFARLLLWTLPVPLPGPHEDLVGYGQYLAAWRPGKPRPSDWPAHYREAWQIVDPLAIATCDCDDV